MTQTPIDPLCFITAAEALTGLERTTIHRRAKGGTFPVPIYVGRRRAWRRSQLEEWIRSQAQNRTPPPAPRAAAKADL